MKQNNKTFIFEPPAQNTIIRPMAEAICIVQGGKTVPYTDTADGKQKSVCLADLHGGRVQSAQGKISDAFQIAQEAIKTPLRIRVDVNDVHVFISKKTTVLQAMADFHKKITAQNKRYLIEKQNARQYD